MSKLSLLQREELVSLGRAAEWVRSRSGRKTHVSSIHRWALRGCRGRKLETVLIGRVRMTSKEALCRFFEEPASSPSQEPSATATSVEKARPQSSQVGRDVEQLHQRLFNQQHPRRGA
jgi:hypothetical protein